MEENLESEYKNKKGVTITRNAFIVTAVFW
jgi:hypothetical protein